jgi:hypothetical protein
VDPTTNRTQAAHLRPQTLPPTAGADIVRVSAGPGGHLPGDTNLCLQAAVDYVATLGGGLVEVRPGRYLMRDSLHLRSRVTVRGAGEQTVLVKASMAESAVTAYLGYGHFDVSVAEPQKFPPGTGIHVQDDHSGGFYTTTATVLYRVGDRLGISRFLNHDYGPGAHAVVRSVFPVVSACGVEDAAVEDLTVEGNAAENGRLNGCRGAGVFLIQADRTALRRLLVRDYHGDGISFQQCCDTLVEDCRSEENRGIGFHPGSGSVRPIMRRLVARRNASDGLYYCLRVSHGVLEESEFIDNGRHGVSIGGRDTDHLIRRCTVRANGGCGVFFRPQDPVMAPSRNVVEECIIERNGRAADLSPDQLQELGLAGVDLAEIAVASPVDGVVLRRNRLRPRSADILIAPTARVTLKDNTIEGDLPSAI